MWAKLRRRTCCYGRQQFSIYGYNPDAGGKSAFRNIHLPPRHKTSQFMFLLNGARRRHSDHKASNDWLEVNSDRLGHGRQSTSVPTLRLGRLKNTTLFRKIDVPARFEPYTFSGGVGGVTGWATGLGLHSITTQKTTVTNVMCVYFLSPTAMSHTILQDIQGADEDRTKYTFPMAAASRLVVGILIQGYGINRSKVRPRTGHKGPEREYRSTLSLTSALHWGGWMDPRASL